MLICIEVSPSFSEDISKYYNMIGFNITSPTKHNIQYLVPDSVLALTNNEESNHHIMECHESITKRRPIYRKRQ